MLNIYIARHGQNEDNVNGILNGHRDLPLTNLGIEQAKELAGYTKETGIIFDKIYSSPLARAYLTASIVAETINLEEPKKWDLLIERNFGIMTGRSINEIEKYCGTNVVKTNTITYFINPEGAETFEDLIVRGNKILSEIHKSHSTGNVLLVCHGDIGKMIYAAYYNLNWLDVLRSFHFGNSELLLLSKSINPEDAHVFKTLQVNH